MLQTLVIQNYRSVLHLKLRLGRLNVITGPNGSGKSNLYRALRLLADTAQGGVVNSLAREGGLESGFWAGPEKISAAMLRGEVPVQGGPKQHRTRLRLGFGAEDFGYAVSFGLPTPSTSAFSLDPEIKREVIWAGPSYRPSSALLDRNGTVVKSRNGRSWEVISQHVNRFDSIFSRIADARAAPEALELRDRIQGWRFYDQFRTDAHAPTRQSQLGTRTPVLHHDGRDLAAAIQTIREIGDGYALDETIDDAFPGSRAEINRHEDGRFSLGLRSQGLLRPLAASELSDGTLRYLCLVAALLTPRPPSLMVLNEPETSLHPDLLPALARLIRRASETSQLWVVTHTNRLVSALNQHEECVGIQLEKNLGRTEIVGQGLLDEPPWKWPDLK